MFSARSFRRFARPALVAALVAPMLMFGSQQAMAAGGGAPGPGDTPPIVPTVPVPVKKTVVDTTVTTSCFAGLGGMQGRMFVAVSTTDPRHIQFIVEHLNGSVIANDLHTLLTTGNYNFDVPWGSPYRLRVLEDDGNGGLPSVVSFDKTYLSDANGCGYIATYAFDVKPSMDCEGTKAKFSLAVTNTGTAKDSYALLAKTSTGTVIDNNSLAIEAGKTTTLFGYPTSGIVEATVTSTIGTETKTFGPYALNDCTAPPADPNAKAFTATADATCQGGVVQIHLAVTNTGSVPHVINVFDNTGAQIAVMPLFPGVPYIVDFAANASMAFTFTNTANPAKSVSVGPWDAAVICGTGAKNPLAGSDTPTTIPPFVIPDTVPPTTVVATTVAPVTVAPTSAVPTTVAAASVTTAPATASASSVDGEVAFEVTTVATCKDGVANMRYTVRNTTADQKTVSVSTETGASAGNLPLGPKASMSIDFVPTATTAFTFSTTKPSQKVGIGPWDTAAICTGYTAPIVKSFASVGVEGADSPVVTVPVRVLGELVPAAPAQAGSDPGLAFTGTDSGVLAAIAAASVLLGGGLVVATRRRRRVH